MTRPTTRVNRFGDRYRVWRFGRAFIEVTETTSIGQVSHPPRYFVSYCNRPKIVGRFSKLADAVRLAERLAAK